MTNRTALREAEVRRSALSDQADHELSRWSADVVAVYGMPLDTERLDAICLNERILPPKQSTPMRVLMSRLDRDLVCTLLVHHWMNGIIKAKVTEIIRLSGNPFSQRDYWNRLDRVRHYVAGYLAGTRLDS